MNTATSLLALADACPLDPEAERLLRIAELKRKIKAGTYLINKYEIIDGIINELASSPAPVNSGESP